MTHTRTARRRRGSASSPGLKIFRGVAAAVLTTLIGVAVFALLMQWIRPEENTVRVFNQVLKLASIAVGVWFAAGKGCDGGLLRGALVGLLYMLLGVAMYALLSGQQAPLTAYLADLGMGVAGGGIVGMLLSNMS